MSAILRIASFKDKESIIMTKKSFIKDSLKIISIMVMASTIGRMDRIIKVLISRDINMEMENMSKEIH